MRWSVFVFSLLLAFPVLGHGLSITAIADGAAVQGEARYSDGSPAAGERVSFYAPPDAQRETAHVITGPDGRYRYPGQAVTAYKVVVEAMEGHRGEAVVTTTGDAGVADPRLAAALRQELAPLREDIARMEKHIRLHDILGGVGYLFGIAGLASLYLNRRKK